VAWDLNNYIPTQLQDIGGRICLKNKSIFGYQKWRLNDAPYFMVINLDSDD
jgi:hypothetical protein